MHQAEERIYGVPVYHDDYLNKFDEPFDLIIASQYFIVIHDRLEKQGKLKNDHLKEIYVPNLLAWPVPYADSPAKKIEDTEWNWLENSLSTIPPETC